MKLHSVVRIGFVLLMLAGAFLAGQHDPAEAATMVARRGVTRQGELVADIAVYEEAKRLYLRLVRDGQKMLEKDLVGLCWNKAFVHETAADLHGAVQEWDQAIAILGPLVNQEGRRELANDLARVYVNKARTGRADLKTVLTWLQKQLAEHSA
jgi:hypothetical protein